MEFRILNENDCSPVIEHLRNNFFSDAPLQQAIRRNNRDGPPTKEELGGRFLKYVRQQCSIGAFENGEIIGVAINNIIKRGDSAKIISDIKKSPKLTKQDKIDLFINETFDKLDLFHKYGVNELFECYILSVDRKARGRNVADELLKRSIQFAQKHGYRIFKADATSKYSLKISLTNGMVIVSEMKFKDYLDADTGLPIFEVSPPHDSITTLIRDLGMSKL